jgi:ribosomal protein L34E
MKFEKCPKCGKEFGCQPNDIENCQCSSVQLTGDELEQISKLYKGCLCSDCLNDLKTNEFKQKKG